MTTAKKNGLGKGLDSLITNKSKYCKKQQQQQQNQLLKKDEKSSGRYTC